MKIDRIKLIELNSNNEYKQVITTKSLKTTSKNWDNISQIEYKLRDITIMLRKYNDFKIMYIEIQKVKNSDYNSDMRYNKKYFIYLVIGLKKIKTIRTETRIIIGE